jgi:drug/metabolite transporter (DMT)-like permease
MPVWTIIIASFFQIEKLNATKITAILLAFGGVVLSLSSNLSDNNGQILTGDIVIIIGVISASIFTVFAKGLIKNYGSQPVMIYALLSGVVFMFLIALLFGSPFAGSLDFNINGWFYVFILGIPSGASEKIKCSISINAFPSTLCLYRFCKLENRYISTLRATSFRNYTHHNNNAV